MNQHSNRRTAGCAAAAGVDVAKARLDVAVWPEEAAFSVDNDAAGWQALAAQLTERGIRRVAMEASGGYERGPAARLAEAGFEVIVLQPLQVRAFARFRGQRAKTDRIDARLIAECAVQAHGGRFDRSPERDRAVDLLTLYEQTAEDLARLRTRAERFRESDLKDLLAERIRELKAFKAALLDRLRKLARASKDLARRVALLQSIPGVGFLNAVSLALRVPELGAMTGNQAAALLGVAPFNHDSGLFRGQRRIAGGRARPRRLLYMAALAAVRTDPGFAATYQRLTAAGKAHKLALVAVMRKLAVAANTVLARQAPWLPQKT